MSLKEGECVYFMWYTAIVQYVQITKIIKNGIGYYTIFADDMHDKSVSYRVIHNINTNKYGFLFLNNDVLIFKSLNDIINDKELIRRFN